MLKNFVHSSQIVKSHATVDGRAAIELSYPGANGTLHLLLWVDAQTYLPLRLEKLHWLNDYPDSKGTTGRPHSCPTRVKNWR